MFEIIHYADGDFEAFRVPSTHTCLQLRVILAELRQRLVDEPSLWPINPDMAEEVARRHWPYLAKLCKIISVDCDRIDPIERFHWLIATPPEEVEGRLRLGLSKLEACIGIQYKANTESISQESEGESQVEGTGDPLIDAITDTHLIFKTAAGRMIDTYPPNVLHQICAYAARRRQEAMEKMQQEHGSGSKSETFKSNPRLERLVNETSAPSPSKEALTSLRRRGIPVPG
ncbi:MAG TPA: hypothetical protein V6D07_18945 [Trichocoleus sp.]